MTETIQAETDNAIISCPSHVTIDTSLGSFEIELYWKHAPKTCSNFVELTKRGYYDNITFHRVIPEFIIQTGDPTGTGRGGVSANGRYFDDEIHPELRHAGAGIVAMANSGPNTNGSQFFITLAPSPHLDHLHTIFGRISSGMQVIKRIGAAHTDADDRPLEDIFIVQAKC